MIARLAGGLALAGGATLLLTAAITTWSVLQRWIVGQPLPGDFEIAAIGAGIAVAGFLAMGTLRGANILVDTFTSWLPPRATRAIDAFWALVWAAVAAILAWRLILGALETRANGTNTLVLAVPTWWAVGLCAIGFAATVATAIAVARR